jgi:TolA-binding protein
MDTMKSYVGKMESQIKQWGIKIDELAAKADAAGAEAKSDYHKRIRDMKTKHQAAQAKLDEVKAAGSEKWETIKGGIESAWNELEASFKKLLN